MLPELLERTLQRKWRALVRTGDVDRVEHLDGWLWTWREETFLPHGVAGEPLADRQPVLITTGQENPNRADALFLIDGADPGDLTGFQRCVVLFDGRDEGALAGARGLWKSVKAQGLASSYWRQGETRGWEKQA